jgi:hypothetical protein
MTVKDRGFSKFAGQHSLETAVGILTNHASGHGTGDRETAAARAALA